MIDLQVWHVDVKSHSKTSQEVKWTLKVFHKYGSKGCHREFWWVMRVEWWLCKEKDVGSQTVRSDRPQEPKWWRESTKKISMERSRSLFRPSSIFSAFWTQLSSSYKQSRKLLSVDWRSSSNICRFQYPLILDSTNSTTWIMSTAEDVRNPNVV